jgi:hypothetical protein
MSDVPQKEERLRLVSITPCCLLLQRRSQYPARSAIEEQPVKAFETACALRKPRVGLCQTCGLADCVAGLW